MTKELNGRISKVAVVAGVAVAGATAIALSRKENRKKAQKLIETARKKGDRLVAKTKRQIDTKTNNLQKKVDETKGKVKEKQTEAKRRIRQRTKKELAQTAARIPPT